MAARVRVKPAAKLTMTRWPTENSIHPDAPDTACGHGQALREARIRAGLSQQDVAQQLRLDVATIRDLEEEDYRRLPAPAFVRGYLRNYAAFLGISPQPLIENFNRCGLQAPSLKAGIARDSSPTATSRVPLRIATLGGLLGAFVLLMVQVYDQHSTAAQTPHVTSLDAAQRPLSDKTFLNEASLVPPQAAAAPLASTDIAPPFAKPTVPSSPPLPTGIDSAPEQTEEPSLPPTLTKPAPASKPTTASPTPERHETKPSSTPLASASPARIMKPPTPEASFPTVEENVVPNPDSTTPDRLAMRFARDSWVEVYDGHGTRLYYSLVKAGEAVAITGSAPFRVLLGDAKGVAIEHNGEPFDHESFIHPQGLARFTLGQPAQPGPSDQSGGVPTTPAPQPDRTPGPFSAESTPTSLPPVRDEAN